MHYQEITKVNPGPIVGVLILFILLFVLFKINDIELVSFFTVDGFKNAYKQNSWIVCLAISIILYAGYGIVTSFFGLNHKNNTEPYDNNVEKQFMSFDRFYQTFVMVPNPLYQDQDLATNVSMNVGVGESIQSEVNQPNKNNIHKSKQILPPNKFLILRTDIDGIKYYLIMDSFTKELLPYRQASLVQKVSDADKADICKVGGSTDSSTSFIFTAPSLIREDLLVEEYKQYIDKAYADVASAVQTKKALDLIESQKSQTKDEPKDDRSESAPNLQEDLKTFLSAFADKKMDDTSMPYIATDTNLTEAQRLLKKTMFPRYIHHFFMNRIMDKTPNDDIDLNDVVGYGNAHILNKNVSINHGEIIRHSNTAETYAEQLNKNNQSDKSLDMYYTLSGLTRDQTSNVLDIANKTPVFLSTTRSFSPWTNLRKKKQIETSNSDDTSRVIEREIPVVNDKKFICGTRHPSGSGSSMDKYYSIYASTVTPSLDNIDSVAPVKTNPNITAEETKGDTSVIKNRIDDSIIFNGRTNTNIAHMDPYVNLYFKADVKNSSGILTKNVKFWFARLDSYKDPKGEPSILDVNSPYQNKPRIYPVGMIPDDYKECYTDKDGTINTRCRGKLYIDGIDYSDARKINFEIATVQLNAI